MELLFCPLKGILKNKVYKNIFYIYNIYEI